MKKVYAFLSISLLMLGCQKSGAPIVFESSVSNLDRLSEPDDDPTDNPGEDVDPLNCEGFDDSTVAISNECASLAADSNLLLLNNGSSIQNFSGNFRGMSGHIVMIENTKGNLVLLGIGNAYIEKIKDTKGNLLICNMDVGSIEKVSAGNIHIDGGSVCKITGHKGNVKVNGRVGEVTDNRGNIEVINGGITSVNANKGNISVIDGNIGDVNGHTGNIHVKNGTITGTITNAIGNIVID